MLAGLASVAPALASCAVARDTRRVASYFADRPHVRSVKDSYDTADASDQVNIDLELDEDATVDNIATLFAEAEPAMRDMTKFPVRLTASWTHGSVRMDQCARATFNSPKAADAYDAEAVRVSVQGALATATETAGTVTCSWWYSRDDGSRNLSYVVDYGTADALPGDILRSLPPEMAVDGYEVTARQEVSVSDWDVCFWLRSTDDSSGAASVPVDALLETLPHPSSDAHIYVGGEKANSSDDLVLDPRANGERTALRWGEPAVRVLEAARWRGVLVLPIGRRNEVRFRFDAGDSPTEVLNEPGEFAEIGALILERAHS